MRRTFDSPAELAGVLDLSGEELDRIIRSAPLRYRAYRAKGGRRIEEPREELKEVQRLLHDRLLRPALPSMLRWRSHIDAVKHHLGSDCLGRVDIAAFFPSVTSPVVRSRLAEELTCSTKVAGTLDKLLTTDGHLATGSPASPAAAALVIANTVREVVAFAEQLAAKVSVWGDDILLSGDRLAVEMMQDLTIRGIHRVGLRPNREKTEIMPNRRRQREVFGLSVEGVARVPGRYRKKVRDDLRRVERYGADESEIRRLQGQIAYIGRTHPEVAANMKMRLSSVAQAH